MKKYWQIFKISWQNSLVYRFNLIMWQLRVMIGFLGIYWLWQAVFSQTGQVGPYNQSSLMVYLTVALILRTLVFSNISFNACVEIANGDLNNYLLKPVDYFKNWLARDWADKVLNLLFLVFELVIFVAWLHLPLAWPQQPVWFLLIVLAAVFLYFFYSFLLSAFSFWYPEHDGWPLRFFALMLLEFLAGMAFPLDIFPPALLQAFKALPFYYFIFYPVQVYLGRANPGEAVIMAAWLVIMVYLSRLVWKKGLRIYGAYGR